MLRKLILKLGMSWLGGELRAIAEGKRGPSQKAAYDFMAGKKRVTGSVLAIVSVVALALDHGYVATSIASAAAFLLSTGLIDASWRSSPDSWAEASLYRLLRDHWADVVVVIGTTTAWLTTCSPDAAGLLSKVHLTCSSALMGVTAIAASLGWAVGEAKLAPPPRAKA